MSLMEQTAPATMVVEIDQVSVDTFAHELEAQNPGAQVRRVRGSRSRDWSGLSDELAAALQFPSYYGGNWAALEDCLRDMRTTGVHNYIILVSESAQLLVDGIASEFETFVGIVADVDFEWQEDASEHIHTRLRLFLAEAPHLLWQLEPRLEGLTVDVGRYRP